jgi:cyclase
MEHMKKVNVVQYDKDLTLVLGGGGNSGILVSDSLVLVIDTKMDDAALNFSKMAKDLAGKKPILVVNTHYHPDHTQGNKYFKGQTIIAGGNYSKEFWLKEAGEESMPTEWLKDKKDIKMGDDTATLYNLGRNVHTASDVVVYLHKRKMLFTGDVVLNKQAPVLIGTADADGYMAAFDLLPKMFDVQKIVPGHGAVGGPEVISDFRQFFKDMEMAARDASKKDELIGKYKDWGQLPVFMSPGATISYYKKKLQL